MPRATTSWPFRLLSTTPSFSPPYSTLEALPVEVVACLRTQVNLMSCARLSQASKHLYACLQHSPAFRLVSTFRHALARRFPSTLSSEPEKVLSDLAALRARLYGSMWSASLPVGFRAVYNGVGVPAAMHGEVDLVFEWERPGLPLLYVGCRYAQIEVLGMDDGLMLGCVWLDDDKPENRPVEISSGFQEDTESQHFAESVFDEKTKARFGLSEQEAWSWSKQLFEGWEGFSELEEWRLMLEEWRAEDPEDDDEHTVVEYIPDPRRKHRGRSDFLQAFLIRRLPSCRPSTSNASR
ncbi:uncharacterized protein EV422DRAFT_93572 [Fimicolochytrium jonesii]|uniref:uncharacterized protein n=1 Tax=Fimicolochytrium jonesii TaxID=1396493 RepID=UPI0022FED3EB|nr:uncharacterized protein EV422DRAFT_93572 [Fimicolochytrium jonesii]KAI8819969.1 hypothetical protein EV422DRAFT_93572 [Fimicolochytrium jonesii]